MKNTYDKIKSSRNELEAILRIRGISKQKFGRILNIKGATIEKYLDHPYYLRYYQMDRLAKFLNINVRDIIDIIECDLEGTAIVIQGEEGYSAIEPLASRYSE
mgnify:CR=1 FL=1